MPPHTHDKDTTLGILSAHLVKLNIPLLLQMLCWLCLFTYSAIPICTVYLSLRRSFWINIIYYFYYHNHYMQQAQQLRSMVEDLLLSHTWVPDCGRASTPVWLSVGACSCWTAGWGWWPAGAGTRPPGVCSCSGLPGRPRPPPSRAARRWQHICQRTSGT